MFFCYTKPCICIPSPRLYVSALYQCVSVIIFSLFESATIILNIFHCKTLSMSVSYIVSVYPQISRHSCIIRLSTITAKTDSVSNITCHIVRIVTIPSDNAIWSVLKYAVNISVNDVRYFLYSFVQERHFNLFSTVEYIVNTINGRIQIGLIAPSYPFATKRQLQVNDFALPIFRNGHIDDSHFLV